MRFKEVYKDAIARGASKGFLMDVVRGLPPEQVAEVEADQGVEIPLAYQEFLEFCGNSQGGALASEDVFYPEVLGLKEAAIECLVEGGSGETLDEYVVFLMHQGYIFYCMKTDQSDPLVFGYSSAEKGGLISEDATFSEFISHVLAEGL